MLAEQQRRSLCDDVQYLTDRQLERLVEQMPDNDINDYEDLQSGGWARGRWAGRVAEGPRWVGLGPMGISEHRHRAPEKGCLQRTANALWVLIWGHKSTSKSWQICRQMPSWTLGRLWPPLWPSDQHVGSN